MFACMHTHVHEVSNDRLKWNSLKKPTNFLLCDASLLMNVTLPTLGHIFFEIMIMEGVRLILERRKCVSFPLLWYQKKPQLTQAYSLLWLCFSWFSLWLIDSVALGEEIHHDRSMEWTELIISWPRAERDEEEVAEALWPSLRACSLWTEAISWGSTSWNFHSIQ